MSVTLKDLLSSPALLKVITNTCWSARQAKVSLKSAHVSDHNPW